MKKLLKTIMANKKKNPYETADKTMTAALLASNRLFEQTRAKIQLYLNKQSNRLKTIKANAANPDILNIAAYVDSLYNGIDKFNIGAYKSIVPQVYQTAWDMAEDVVDTKGKKKSVLGLAWITALLSSFNVISQWVYEQEVPRKAEYFKQQLSNALLSNLLMGEKMSMTAPNINAIFTQAKNWWGTQSDTQMTLLVSEAMTTAYKDAGVKKVIYSTIDDDRRSQICTDLDGTIIDVDDINVNNSPPQHPNCRSFFLPYE